MTRLPPGFPSYAFADDSSYARGENGEGQLWYNYGFSIPSGATIDGIEVRLDAWYSSLGTSGTLRVFLSWDGGTSLTGYKDAVLTDSETKYLLGGLGWPNVLRTSGIHGNKIKPRDIPISSR